MAVVNEQDNHDRQRLDSPLVYVGAHNVYYVKYGGFVLKFMYERAYRKHLNAAPYKAFAARAPDIIDRKKKITLEPQFLGDKHIIPNERTINNLVIVEVKPEFQSEFRNIVLPEMVESLKVEKGVLAMYAGTDSETPKRWYFYEIYASEEDYQLHRQTLHFLDYLRQTAHMSARKDAIPVKPVFLRNKGGIKQEPQR